MRSICPFSCPRPALKQRGMCEKDEPPPALNLLGNLCRRLRLYLERCFALSLLIPAHHSLASYSTQSDLPTSVQIAEACVRDMFAGAEGHVRLWPIRLVLTVAFDLLEAAEEG